MKPAEIAMQSLKQIVNFLRKEDVTLPTLTKTVTDEYQRGNQGRIDANK
jgi:hypothetical protein